MQNLNKLCLCGLKYGMRNWVNVHSSTQKSEKLYFDGLFLSKAYNVSAKKFHRNYEIMNYILRLKGDKKFLKTDSWLEK